MPLEDWTFGGPAPSIRAVEESFRHSGWAADRSRVLTALRAAGEPAEKIRRFRECGRAACVEYSKKLNVYRVKAFHCGHRFCKPCSNKRARIIRERLEALCKGKRVWFITFTRRATERTLADALNDLRSPFRDVRESVLWRSSFVGGGMCVEIKEGRGSKLWHVHGHVLCVGREIDAFDLRRLWQKVTGDSHQVDVQEVKGDRKQISYTAKYASKGWTNDVLRKPNRLVECVRALRGRRLFSTFGEWWGADVDTEVEKATDWRNLGRLHVLYAASLRGDLHARGVFVGLGLVAGAVAGEPIWLMADDDG